MQTSGCRISSFNNNSCSDNAFAIKGQQHSSPLCNIIIKDQNEMETLLSVDRYEVDTYYFLRFCDIATTITTCNNSRISLCCLAYM